jgi:hypothetical protein
MSGAERRRRQAAVPDSVLVDILAYTPVSAGAIARDVTPLDHPLEFLIAELEDVIHIFPRFHPYHALIVAQHSVLKDYLSLLKSDTVALDATSVDHRVTVTRLAHAIIDRMINHQIVGLSGDSFERSLLARILLLYAREIDHASYRGYVQFLMAILDVSNSTIRTYTDAVVHARLLR